MLAASWLCCCCLAAACGPGQGSAPAAQLSSALTDVVWQHTEHPGHHSAPGSLLCQPGMEAEPQTAFWSHWEVPLLLKQWDWRKGNKFKDFYILRAQIHMLHKPELLIPEMRQNRSRLVIGSGPTFVWYWQSHLSAMKSWQNLPDSPLLPTSPIAQVELFYQLLWVCMRPLVWPVWEIRAKQGIMDPIELILTITES